jgi:hypothetical protein
MHLGLVSEIDLLLEKRHHLYPVRDDVYFNLQEKISTLTLQLLSDIEEIRWEPDLGLVAITQQFIDVPVFICGGMKTGTTLLTQLLDHHPSLVMMPGDSNMFTKFHHYSGSFTDLSCHWIQRLINPSGKKPFWFLGRDLSAYKEFLLYLTYFQTTDYNTFQSVVAAIYCANPKRSSDVKYWVEKTPENEINVLTIAKAYPKARFIHVWRDPLVNAASIKKMKGFKGEKFSVLDYAIVAKRLILAGVENQKQLGTDIYRFVKYEDVITNSEHELKQIVEHLSIEYNQILVRPTENGVLGIANSMYQEGMITGQISVGGINNRWENELSKNEKEYIVTHLYDLALSNRYTDWQKLRIKKFHKPQSLKSFLIRAIERLIGIRNSY